MNSEEVYLELRRIGCCNRCCLRFMGQTFCDFENPEQSLQDLLPITLEEQIKSKKVKPNACSVCMGLLEDSFLDQLLPHACWKELDQYETDVYRINLNTPANVSIRNKSICLYMKQKFPDFYEVTDQEEVLRNMHNVFKLAFKTKLDQNCGKRYNVHSGVQLCAELYHEDCDKEVQVMEDLDPDTYRKRRYMGDKIFGKNAVNKTLSTVNEKTFFRFVQIPPPIPSNPLKILNVKFESLPIFIGGRYCKYSRTVSQTPWLQYKGDENDLECKKRNDTMVTNCVQQIITEGLREVFGFSEIMITFSPSGREDTDVRCLGSGRPFYMKIDSVRKTYPVDLFRKLENKINQSPDISVFDMQLVDKTAAREVKVGEEMKQKIYIALCIIRDHRLQYIDKVLETINGLGTGTLTINQKTPVRVSHRRTLKIRQKKIFQMKAAEISGHNDLFQLTLRTQAGTYIKEFVHGDFGRTYPCLSSLVNADIDLYRLDVVGIALDWPKHINSVPHPAMKGESNNMLDIEGIKQEPGSSSEMDEDANMTAKDRSI